MKLYIINVISVRSAMIIKTSDWSGKTQHSVARVWLHCYHGDIHTKQYLQNIWAHLHVYRMF